MHITLRQTLALALVFSSLVQAGEDTVAPKVEPELTPDKELLAKIEALPDNTWLKLPAFKVTGALDWLGPQAEERKRGPFGRSYCGYAVWAPERKRAIYMGGGHNVRRWCDVWEYDLAANTWVCLLGNDPAGMQKNTEEWFREHTILAEDGCITTKSGGPVAVAHTWNQFCYDPDRRVALWINSMPRSVEYSVKLDQPDNVAVKGLGMSLDDFQKKLCKDGIYVWEFDPSKRKFTKREFVVNLKSPGNTTGGRQEEGFMRYIPDLKGAFFSGRLRDPKTGEWKPFGGKGGPRWYGYCGDYDPHTKRLFAHQGPNTFALSIETGEWQQVGTTGPKDYSVRYDPVAKELISMTAAGVFGLDTTKNEWVKKPDPQGDLPAPGPYELSYYDPERNVHVSYNCSDVYVYRYKRAPNRR